MKKILITGAAGFIGFHLVKNLAEEGYEITGLDNINNYYDVNLKYARLKETGILKSKTGKIRRLTSSSKYQNYKFVKLDILDGKGINNLFKKHKFDYVIHLAAQAGVRYSLINPQVYIDSNITGFFNILEACRTYRPKHLLFASSSSVYGNNNKTPFRETDNTDSPVSLYAATKKANEVMAHSYSSLYGIPVTGLRFFTVYGPWGRPDMAYFSFAERIIKGKPIEVYGNGKLMRDFTYIDDITEIVSRILKIKQIYSDNGKFNILNLGNDNPVMINYFISLLEKNLKRKAKIIKMPAQKGDVLYTHADTIKTSRLTGYKPLTGIEYGIKSFCEWFLSINRKA